jgi:molybdopterin molybdotransferase
MLSVSEAVATVLQHTQRLPSTVHPLTAAVLGAVLAEDVVSDLDMPPYDKSMVDGYAVRCADLPEGKGTLQVVEEVTAGRMPTRALTAGQATHIMTGAPIPEGADAVVMVERTRTDGQHVTIEDRPPRPGSNIMRRATEMRSDEVVLSAGAVLRPQEFGVLATVGRVSAALYPSPRVAVLSTGDEVVEAPQRPQPGQIRNGNGPMICAQVSRAGGVPQYLGIARDKLDSLRPLVREGLSANVLVLSGGVSAGKLDLVPGVLEEAGVTPVFHKVEMKPGKPVFFGIHSSGLVFGLPGNPVSALVCFELFVRPALRCLAGHDDSGPFYITAILAENFTYRTDRPTYYPAWIESPAQESARAEWTVRAVPWHGSPDLRGLTRANAFVVVPAGEHHYQAGQKMTVLRVE